MSSSPEQQQKESKVSFYGEDIYVQKMKKIMEMGKKKQENLLRKCNHKITTEDYKRYKEILFKTKYPPQKSLKRTQIPNLPQKPKIPEFLKKKKQTGILFDTSSSDSDEEKQFKEQNQEKIQKDADCQYSEQKLPSQHDKLEIIDENDKENINNQNMLSYQEQQQNQKRNQISKTEAAEEKDIRELAGKIVSIKNKINGTKKGVIKGKKSMIKQQSQSSERQNMHQQSSNEKNLQNTYDTENISQQQQQYKFDYNSHMLKSSEKENFLRDCKSVLSIRSPNTIQNQMNLFDDFYEEPPLSRENQRKFNSKQQYIQNMDTTQEINKFFASPVRSSSSNLHSKRVPFQNLDDYQTTNSNYISNIYGSFYNQKENSNEQEEIGYDAETNYQQLLQQNNLNQQEHQDQEFDNTYYQQSQQQQQQSQQQLEFTSTQNKYQLTFDDFKYKGPEISDYEDDEKQDSQIQIEAQYESAAQRIQDRFEKTQENNLKKYQIEDDLEDSNTSYSQIYGIQQDIKEIQQGIKESQRQDFQKNDSSYLQNQLQNQNQEYSDEDLDVDSQIQEFKQVEIKKYKLSDDLFQPFSEQQQQQKQQQKDKEIKGRREFNFKKTKKRSQQYYDNSDGDDDNDDFKVINELKMSKIKRDMHNLEKEKETISHDIKGLEIRKRKVNRESFHQQQQNEASMQDFENQWNQIEQSQFDITQSSFITDNINSERPAIRKYDFESEKKRNNYMENEDNSQEQQGDTLNEQDDSFDDEYWMHKLKIDKTQKIEQTNNNKQTKELESSFKKIKKQYSDLLSSSDEEKEQDQDFDQENNPNIGNQDCELLNTQKIDKLFSKTNHYEQKYNISLKGGLKEAQLLPQKHNDYEFSSYNDTSRQENEVYPNVMGEISFSDNFSMNLNAHNNQEQSSGILSSSRQNIKYDSNNNNLKIEKYRKLDNLIEESEDGDDTMKNNNLSNYSSCYENYSQIQKNEEKEQSFEQTEQSVSSITEDNNTKQNYQQTYNTTTSHNRNKSSNDAQNIIDCMLSDVDEPITLENTKRFLSLKTKNENNFNNNNNNRRETGKYNGEVNSSDENDDSISENNDSSFGDNTGLNVNQDNSDNLFQIQETGSCTFEQSLAESSIVY